MKNAAILNGGSGAWAFELLANSLSAAFEIPVQTTPADWNYVLAYDGDHLSRGRSFIPFEAVEIATDKRLTARVFNEHQVPTPRTCLLDSKSELNAFLNREKSRRWLLKWPTGCGGSGHRFIESGEEIRDDWPLPFVVQEFVAMQRPEVFRLYGVAGELFGWNARRFAGESHSVFVAHAQGARYESAGEAPLAAQIVARAALEATNLWNSFGCVDLLRDHRDQWLALEVNTDGRWMHVDRDVSIDGISAEITARLARAFEIWRNLD